jgi:hypothetical protein
MRKGDLHCVAEHREGSLMLPLTSPASSSSLDDAAGVVEGGALQHVQQVNSLAGAYGGLKDGQQAVAVEDTA